MQLVIIEIINCSNNNTIHLANDVATNDKQSTTNLHKMSVIVI